MINLDDLKNLIATNKLNDKEKELLKKAVEEISSLREDVLLIPTTKDGVRISKDMFIWLPPQCYGSSRRCFARALSGLAHIETPHAFGQPSTYGGAVNVDRCYSTKEIADQATE